MILRGPLFLHGDNSALGIALNGNSYSGWPNIFGLFAALLRRRNARFFMNLRNPIPVKRGFASSFVRSRS
jgi:hypothetical protein